MATYSKDPQAVLDYTINWSSWLPTGDTILTSSWSASPAGITIDSNTNDDTSATVWLSGGTEGATYLVTNEITTVGGRTELESIRLNMVKK